MTRAPMRGLLAVVASLALGCEPPCAMGEACNRECGPQSAAVCAAEGLCTCVPVADEAPPDGDAGGGRCRPPAPGELVINEILLDGEPTEDAEFVELVNVSGEPIGLRGLVLSGTRGDGFARRVSFSAGCLGVDTAVALYGRQADWRWSQAPTEPVVAELNAFGFANQGPFEFRLEDSMGQLITDAAGNADLGGPGLSLNRQPDLSGADFVAHTQLAARFPSSPAHCPNQGTYARQCDDGAASPDAGPAEPPDGGLGPCRRPEAGELIINEIMIDGDPDADQEFVELVNVTDDALALGGVQLESNSGQRVVRRLIFTEGCIVALGAVAMFPAYDQWIWTPDPLGRPRPDISRFSFPNGADFAFQLLSADSALLDSATGPRELIEEGVSVNRRPDIVGQEFVRHTALSPLALSPGRCPNGGTYLARCDDATGGLDAGPPPDPDAAADAELPLPCQPPEPGQVVISEVLVDGEVPRTEDDEFVEIVNVSEGAILLTGLTIAQRPRDGGRASSLVVFGPGCAPAGAVVALTRSPDRRVWEPALAPEPPFTTYRLRLANAGEYAILLTDGQGVELDEFDVVGLPIEPGVSLNRSPDVFGAERVLHTALSPLPQSPGRCPNGETFAVNPGCSAGPADGPRDAGPADGPRDAGPADGAQ